MKLYIANKKYSSWSFRPWLAMVVKGVNFEEVLQPFDMAAGNIHFQKFSPTGKVPCLVDGEITVWESLAILEYLADKFPAKNFWPKNSADRAMARSISSEMLGGFLALRNQCPMNMSRPIKHLQPTKETKKDVQRIEEIWAQCLQKSGGPFLFGEFSNADAMYAPVVNRLEVYQLSNADSARHYTLSMKNLPAWQQWEKAGRAETWIVDEDEA